MHSLYERLKDGFHRNGILVDLWWSFNLYLSVELFRDLESFVAHINRHLEPFGFGIKSGRAENATGDVFWVFVRCARLIETVSLTGALAWTFV